MLDFMQYLALYHANANETQVSSPKGLRKAFTISEKLFWFAAFQSLAKVGLHSTREKNRGLGVYASGFRVQGFGQRHMCRSCLFARC